MRPHDTRGMVRKWEKRYRLKFRRMMKAVVRRIRERGLQ